MSQEAPGVWMRRRVPVIGSAVLFAVLFAVIPEFAGGQPQEGHRSLGWRDSAPRSTLGVIANRSLVCYIVDAPTGRGALPIGVVRHQAERYHQDPQSAGFPT